MRPTIALLLAGSITLPGVAAPPQPLVVSANHRFLQRADGSPFFWLGDTAWLLFSRLDRAATLRYLDNRQAKRFTVIQAVLVHSPEMRAATGAAALVNGDPAHPRVTTGSDPADPNQYDYWDHVDWVVGEAAARGLYMALLPVWGSVAKTGALNERNAADYARFLARRYRRCPNVVWVLGGDAKGNEQIETWRILGRTLRAEDPKHLITYHPFGRTDSSDWFHTEPWLDFNMFQSGHRRYDQDDTPRHFGEDNWRYVLDDYAKDPPKPVLDAEPSYEGIPQGLHDGTQPYWTAADARRYAYWSVFAGAFGHTYGHNAVMQFHGPDSGPGDCSPKSFWYQAMDDPGAGQMQHLAALMLSRPFFDRVPDTTAVVSGSGPRHEYVIATRGSGYEMVYSPTGRPFELRLGVISGTALRAWWYNPRDGSAEAIGLLKNSGTRSFTPPGEPGEGHDWVLVLDDAAKNYAPPGPRRR